MSFYKFKDDSFVYSYSNYEKTNVLNSIENELNEYVINSNLLVSSIIDYKEQFDEKVLIKIKTNNEKFYGLIVVEEIDFFDLNKVTIQNLSYFTELLSLQVQKSLVYKKQKETSFAYNDKDVYNVEFLKKMLLQEISLANRHDINSSLLLLKSYEVSELDKTAEDKLFSKMEKLLKKSFRTNDLLFFNHLNNSFTFLLPMTQIDNISYIIKKIEAFNLNYEFSIEPIEINKETSLDILNQKLGIVS